MAQWDILLVSEGRQLTGVDEVELRRKLSSGELQPEDCIRKSGETRWRRVAELKGRAANADKSGEESAQIPPASRVPAVQISPEQNEASEHKEEEDQIASWSRHSEVDPLDMTPMVDVVLLLLLFFMVTASYSLQKILEIPKPNPEKNRAAQKSRNDLMKEYIILEIDNRNQMLIEDEPLKGRKLSDALKLAMTETGKRKLLVIADGDSYHGSSIQAIDAGTDVGVEKPIAFSVRTDE